MFTLMMDFGRVAQNAIKTGMAEYKTRKGDATPAALSVVVLRETREWNPTLKGRPVLTPALRTQLAQALGGLAYNMAAVEAGKEIA